MRRIILGLATLHVSAAALIGQANQCPGDMNNDAIVNLEDLLTLLIHYGDTCDWNDPEPSSPPDLFISEIHYNPSSIQGNDSDWEFLELYNPNGFPVALSGWTVNNAVTCSFAPEDTIPALGLFVLARNLDTLLSVLPEAALARQWHSGQSLNNTGETIEVVAPDGTIVSFVAYEDDDGWVAEPDGMGPSLEWMDPNLPNGAVDSWTFSLVFGGTPGLPNSMWGLGDPE